MELAKRYDINELVYIGLSDIVKNGIYEWENSMNNVNRDGLIERNIFPSNHDLWCTNSSNRREMGSNCVAIRITSDNRICYESQNCSLNAYFVCESGSRLS